MRGEQQPCNTRYCGCYSGLSCTSRELRMAHQPTQHGGQQRDRSGVVAVATRVVCERRSFTAAELLQPRPRPLPQAQ